MSREAPLAGLSTKCFEEPILSASNKKWLRGPLNNRGKTRGAFGGDWNKARGAFFSDKRKGFRFSTGERLPTIAVHGAAFFSEAERIPLPHAAVPIEKLNEIARVNDNAF